MPSVNDIANIASALEKHEVVAVPDRCVAVRNRNVSCRACVRACAFGAVSVAANELAIDNSSCVGCGACVVACPTEAIVALNAVDSALAEAGRAACTAAGGHAVVACARISSKHTADPSLYVEVPCLSRVDETLLVLLAAHGSRMVTLVDGTCRTCKHRDCVAGLAETLNQFDLLCERSGESCDVVRASAFPDDIVPEDATGMHGSTRRGFFADAYGAARETAFTAARATIEQELGIKPEQLAIGERLRVTAAGSLPTIPVPRHDRLLDAFDALGGPIEGRLESRRFATVSIDVAKCNSCGMCAVFCPTGALARNEVEKVSDPIEYVEFSASACVNCALCRDVCWKGALSLEEGVDIAQLYDFEPVVIELPHVKKASPFGSW